MGTGSSSSSSTEDLAPKRGDLSESGKDRGECLVVDIQVALDTGPQELQRPARVHAEAERVSLMVYSRRDQDNDP